VANAMEYNFSDGGPLDLVLCSETICYLGWLYSFFDIAWFAAELFAATRSGGRFLLTNTYRDLFLNVGYRIETEEIFHGTKNGVDFEILISLLKKP
jgi:hypothetical protein